MKKTEEWGTGSYDYPMPPSPDGETMSQEFWTGNGAMPGYPNVKPGRKAKSKWIAGLLAFLVPGIGHMYLGRMSKGILLMLLVAMDIVAIVFASIEGDNALPIVMLAVLLPIIYFYNLFDAIQGGESGNDSRFAKKRKWAAGLLAFMIPGIGHMYLGLTLKGIILMLLVALDVSAIVYVSESGNNVLSIVLLSLLLPIIYFYNLFDAIQSTDIMNDRRTLAEANSPRGPEVGRGMGIHLNPVDKGLTNGIPPIGILFLAIAGVAILLIAGMNWTNWVFHSFSSMAGAVILIGAGVGLWIWESRGHQRN